MDPIRRLSLQSITTGALGLATLRPAAAQTPSAQRSEAQASALLKQRLAYQGVGLVAVQVQGAQLSVVAEGLPRASSLQAIRTDALFEVGSITKTFTALLLADAVLRKLVALDGAVEDALPGHRLRDKAGEPIRWLDLATHRSGLPRLPDNLKPAQPADPYADYSEAQLLQFVDRHGVQEARNTRWAYSNLGYGLLGYALGRALGGGYARQLQQQVLKPLGLDEAWLSLPAELDRRLVAGHNGQGSAVPHWHFDVLAPAGALVMSGASLGRYAQAALGVIDTPLREAFALAQREHAPGATPANPMGLAWVRAPLNGRTVLNHDGGTFGFSSSLWLDPGRQRATAVLSNAMVEVKDLALHLLDPAIPATDFSLTRQTVVAQTDAQRQAVVGVYALNPQFKITVSAHGGTLLAQASGQGSFELFASGPRRYFAKVTPLQVEFSDEARPSTLVLTQAGQTLRFQREP